MWRRLRKQLAIQDAELSKLVEFHRELLEKSQHHELTGIELSASAAFLHSMYSSIENFFRRICIELGEELPTASDWHQKLLRSMTRASSERPRVISDELHRDLRAYLEFRHLFRNISLFRLEWDKMAPLVRDAERVIERTRAEMGNFAEIMDRRHATRSPPG